ncbi:MAG: hypothetical protein K6L76_05450 [Agarilytica sp.]
MQSTLELVSFALKPNADETQLADLQPAVNTFVKQQPGFYYRSLIKDSDGQYLDIVYWESEEKAKAAAEKFMAQPWAEQMMSLVDESSIKMRHVQSISEIGYDSDA